MQTVPTLRRPKDRHFVRREAILYLVLDPGEECAFCSIIFGYIEIAFVQFAPRLDGPRVASR